jgi:hypothetical protein
LLIAYLSLLAATGQPTKTTMEPACADVLPIEASAQDERELRDHLRKGSLSKPMENCEAYRVRLTRAGPEGWQVQMSSEESSRKFEREVSKLTHAATWIEAWLQSGFAAAQDEPTRDSAIPSAASAPAPAPAPKTSVPAAAPIPVFFAFEPTGIVTDRGNSLLGAALLFGLPARHNPWFGVELGGAAQLGVTGSQSHRAYWAGPTAGVVFPLVERLRLRPAASLGVMASSTTSGHTAGVYMGVGGELEYDLATNLSLTVGVDARVFFERLFGSSQTTVTQRQTQSGGEEDDSEENKGTVTTFSIPTPDLGQWLFAARAGILLRFGGSS